MIYYSKRVLSLFGVEVLFDTVSRRIFACNGDAEHQQNGDLCIAMRKSYTILERDVNAI